MTDATPSGPGQIRAVGRWAARVAAYCRRRAAHLGELWRRSLQIKVVVSTLALSTAVVSVLGMVLQNQITDRLLETKEQNAIGVTRESLRLAQRELAGANPNSDDVGNRLNSALTRLTSSSPNEDTATSAAGVFEPVLANDPIGNGRSDVISAGTYDDVPTNLSRMVQRGRLAVQIHTADRPGAGRTTFLMVGASFGTASLPMQLYLLFPLTAEQQTVSLVQNTLMIGAMVLLALLASIAHLVTQQVVRPVRSAAQAAERFADGELDERMTVVGEDDVAKLAESYNEMAESIERQIRQLEEFGQLQRRFTSDVSHELRTPLTTVRMAADVLHASREQFPTGLARSAELLVDELDRFEALLADLLEISRLDAGVEELAAEVTDLRPIARRAAASVAMIARTADTEVVLDLPDEPVEAEVDTRRVERVLRNLLANAVDHGEGRPVPLRVAYNDTAVAITVRDFGIGLRQGEAELVFNRFWRSDPSRNRHTGGTGLGLAISLEDARLHGGGLDAWGEPGRGACFRLTLPRTQGVEYAASPLALPPPDDEARYLPPERPTDNDMTDMTDATDATDATDTADTAGVTDTAGPNGAGGGAEDAAEAPHEPEVPAGEEVR